MGWEGGRERGGLGISLILTGLITADEGDNLVEMDIWVLL